MARPTAAPHVAEGNVALHVAPVDLRAVRQNGLVIRFAMLGPMMYVLTEIPSGGSAGTSLERPCTQAHWAFVIEGELSFVTAAARQTTPSGRAFHVPAGGPEHHFESIGAGLIAALQPVEGETDVSDESLAAQGFELLESEAAPTIVPAVPRRNVATGTIQTESWPMSAYLMTRVRMGERSGYTSGWCDLPHWGMVTDGRLAIEWEDDVELLSTGDVFHCPAGPPGHRLEAADPATFVDLSPIAALRAGGRVAEWRRDADLTVHATPRGIAVAALG